LRINKREIGTFYENQAAEFLAARGLKILERNFRNRQGEIDLIAKEDSTIVFVEVKYRFDGSAGEASAAVDQKKQRIISKVALYYLYTRLHSLDLPCRFDVIAIDGEKITWIQNAFDYQG
jgi:putative endonuclease